MPFASKPLYYILYYIRRFFLWCNVVKRYKFKRALKRYAAEIETWEKQNDGPPPICWYPPDKDYIWVTREMRKNFHKRIKKEILT